MTAQHTPGPWRIDGAAHQCHVFGKAPDGTDWILANCATFPTFASIHREVCQANARLIAAAPDLLKALIAASNEIHNPGCARSVGQDIEEIISAALKKAAP